MFFYDYISSQLHPYPSFSCLETPRGVLFYSFAGFLYFKLLDAGLLTSSLQVASRENSLVVHKRRQTNTSFSRCRTLWFILVKDLSIIVLLSPDQGVVWCLSPTQVRHEPAGHRIDLQGWRTSSLAATGLVLLMFELPLNSSHSTWLERYRMPPIANPTTQLKQYHNTV